MDLAEMGSIYCGVHAASNNVKCEDGWEIDKNRDCNPTEATLQTVRTFVRSRRERQRQERIRERQERIDRLVNRDGARRRARSRRNRREFDKNNIKF